MQFGGFHPNSKMSWWRRWQFVFLGFVVVPLWLFAQETLSLSQLAQLSLKGSIPKSSTSSLQTVLDDFYQGPSFHHHVGCTSNQPRTINPCHTMYNHSSICRLDFPQELQTCLPMSSNHVVTLSVITVHSFLNDTRSLQAILIVCESADKLELHSQSKFLT